jgi:hypothetical protein
MRMDAIGADGRLAEFPAPSASIEWTRTTLLFADMPHMVDATGDHLPGLVPKERAPP